MKKMKILCYCLFLALALPVGAAAPRYFVVADHPMDAQGRLLEFGNSAYDSCLVPISDTNDIAYARLLYQRNNPGRYPDADDLIGLAPLTQFSLMITPFATYNRDYMSSNTGLWEWTVGQFLFFQPMDLTFADNNVGSPTETTGIQRIDTDLAMLTEDYYGILRFRAPYSIVGELPIQPTAFLPNGWKKSGWLGVFYDASYPWIYSEALGWLYLVPGKLDPFDIWMYIPDQNLGWVWTSENVYPYVWSSSQNTWLDMRASSK